MAVCTLCNQEMITAVGCDPSLRVGVTRYGRDDDAVWYWALKLPGRCRDCGVRKGAAHHPGCCIAGCTACGEQRMVCPCDDDVW